MTLRDKYNHAIQVAKGFRMEGSADERDGKLYFLGTAATTTYTVKAGDTLSKIAKDTLGNASSYMAIFEANKDQLTDPDKIKPGQVLKIPART